MITEPRIHDQIIGSGFSHLDPSLHDKLPLISWCGAHQVLPSQYSGFRPIGLLQACNTGVDTAIAKLGNLIRSRMSFNPLCHVGACL